MFNVNEFFLDLFSKTTEIRETMEGTLQIMSEAKIHEVKLAQLKHITSFAIKFTNNGSIMNGWGEQSRVDPKEILYSRQTFLHGTYAISCRALQWNFNPISLYLVM